MTMTKELAREISDDIRETLEGVAAKHGMTIELSGGSYDRESFKQRVTFLTPDAMKHDWENWCWHYDLLPEDFGKVFTSRGEQYRITGLNTRRRKFPITAVRVRDNAPFKFSTNAVKMSLRKEQPVG